MITWMVSRIVRRGFARLSAGDPSAVLGSFGAGARFTFPGEHSWALDTSDRDQIEAWFSRFAHHHPTFVIDDVVVAGPPWRMRVCTRGADRIDLPDGRSYENRWLQYARLSWGKVQEDHVYLDTQKVAGLDRMLEAVDTADGQ